MPDNQRDSARHWRLSQAEGLILPLSDGLAARRFPAVNIVLVVASFAVWLFAHVGGFIFGWIASPDRGGTNRPLSRGNRLPQSAPDQRGHSRKVALDEPAIRARPPAVGPEVAGSVSGCRARRADRRRSPGGAGRR